ncbi:MAG TPA: hypothetical protein VD866_08850, partial [Urbifossiella sp.]|nr:hypothetical protein [Urbifossiella sp.]
MSGAAQLVPLFRYADVPAEHHEWLRRRAEDVTATAYRVVCDYVRIGQILAEVAERLRRRRLFRAWVDAFCPFGRAYAYKLMQVAAAFGPFVRPDADEVITSGALVILSAAPAEVVAYAVEQAGDGHRVNVREARQMVADYRRRVTPSPAVAAAHRAAVAAHEGEELKLAEERARKHEAAAGAWDRLERLARRGVVTVSTVDDAGDDDTDDPSPFHVSALLPGGPRSAARQTLGDALAAVLGEESTRWCPGCKADKPVAEFGSHQGKATGKSS